MDVKFFGLLCKNWLTDECFRAHKKIYILVLSKSRFVTFPNVAR